MDIGGGVDHKVLPTPSLRGPFCPFVGLFCYVCYLTKSNKHSLTQNKGESYNMALVRTMVFVRRSQIIQCS